MCSVTIVDTEVPVAICPTSAPVVTLDSEGNGTLAANALAGGQSSDNCSLTETSPETPFTCTQTGTQMVVLTATDGSSNSNTTMCSVTIVDTEDPVAECPTSALVVTLDSDGNGTLATNALAGGQSSDNCSVTETSPETTFDCTQTGTHMVVLTATDGSNNSNTTMCSVTVNDNEVPVAICPTAPVVTLDTDGNGTLAANALAGGQSSDNCMLTVVELSLIHI